MVNIQISVPIPSGNKTRKESSWVFKARKEECEKQIQVGMILQYSPQKRRDIQGSLNRKKVTIHSQRSKKLDYDNLVAGAKAHLDAVVSRKLIFDDSPKWIDDPAYTQATGKPYYTSITIEDANG